MSLYANEGGTLKEISTLDSGSFKINGIDYIGEFLPAADNMHYVFSIPKTLGYYKFLIMHVLNSDCDAGYSVTYGNSLPFIIPVNTLLRHYNATVVNFSCYYACPITIANGNTGRQECVFVFYKDKDYTVSDESAILKARFVYDTSVPIIISLYGVF